MVNEKNKFEKMVLEKKGWSLYKLAIELGVRDITVYRWNNGKAAPNSKNINKLCKLLNASYREVMDNFLDDR